jgi:hypothetical protein
MEATASASNRKAALLFLLAALIAAAWIGLNLRAPDLSAAGIPLRLVLLLIANGIILYGLWRGLVRTNYSPTNRIAAWVTVALILALWIATTWTLAAHGVFRGGITRNLPALPVAVLLPVLIAPVFLTGSRGIGALLDATPASWLVGLQVYRVLGGVFLVYWIKGAMPGAFALPAGLGDVATGLLALPAAVWVSSGSGIGRKIGIRWNLLGLTDFAVAIAMGMLTSPGPAHLLALDHPNTQLATFPTVMIPAFAVPNSILLHILSLRQLKRLASTGIHVHPAQADRMLRPETASRAN